MSEYIIGTKDEFSAIADALRELKGTTGSYSLPELANEIKTIASTTIEEQEIYPGSSDVVLPEGALLTGDVTIKGDENLVPTNIANGVEIYGIAGTRPDKFDGLTISVAANVDSGTVTATQGDTTVSASLENGGAFLTVPASGEWTLGGTSGERIADSGTATLKGVDNVKVVFFEATVGCYIMGDVSATVTCTNGTKTYTSTGTGKHYFTVYERGNWTVSCVIDGTTWKAVFNAQEHEKQYIEIFNGEPDSTLNNNSWALISIIANTGKAGDYWNIGDAKEITLNGTAGATTYDNVSLWAQIIGINHNPDYEGASSIHFQIGTTAQTGGVQIYLGDAKDGNTISNTAGYFTINYTNNNAGGWASSKMRTVMFPALKAIMPADLASVIKTIPKYTDNVGGGSDHTESNVSATEDDLFLLSEFEVFGQQKYANSYEKNFQKQYAYYSAGNSKRRYRHSNTSINYLWWLRSPYYRDSYYFCYVTSDGSASYSNANRSCGCAPGFAL